MTATAERAAVLDGGLGRLSLNVHGVGVELSSRSEGLLEDLRRDFGYFAREAPRIGPCVRLRLLESPPGDAGPRGLPSVWTPRYAAYDRGPARRIVYSDGPVADYDFQAQEGEIRCADRVRLHELAYLAVLSRVGEALDARGIHRVHALGFEHSGDGGLLLLPSGGGKSVTALEMALGSPFGIVAEDAPFVGPDLSALAFPARWSFLPSADLSRVPASMIRPYRRQDFGPKRLVDTAFFEARIRSATPVRWLLIGRRAAGVEPRIEPASTGAALRALSLNLVIGWGLAQMSEYMVRPTPAGAAALGRIAWSRWRAARRLASGAETFRFTLCDDAARNVRVLERFVDSCRARGEKLA
ncbi:MAG: hypothetical protein HY078_15665 [Elusimicrobia bacterium]|nr:hypothetical protein [Elusimicrobiota bacterium]